MAKKKEPKERKEAYDPKLTINGSFDDVIKASFKKVDKKLKDKR